MGLFRSKKSTRQLPAEPLPDWDNTRWRSHLRANARGIDHHCRVYSEMTDSDRKEAARLFKNDDARARSLAESAIRNNRVVTALAALSPLCNALYQRSEPLAGYTSLAQIPEPARCGIVTIIFSAGRLQMSYLSETVHFLREQFGPLHIDQIQKAEGDLYPLVNITVRDALSAVPATRPEIDAELASAVKQHFGISIQPSPHRSRTTAFAPPPDPKSPSRNPPSATTPPPQATDLRRTQTTPLSALSSDLGAPVSPQLSQERPRPARPGPQHERALKTPSPPRPAPDPRNATQPRPRMYAAKTAPPRYPPTQKAAPYAPAPDPLAASVDSAVKRGRTVPVGKVLPDEVEPGAGRGAFATSASISPARGAALGREQERVRVAGARGEAQFRALPEHLSAFKDSDDMLVARYEHIRSVVSA